MVSLGIICRSRSVLRSSSWSKASLVGCYWVSFSASLNKRTSLIHSKLVRCKIKFFRTAVRTWFMKTDLTHSLGICTETTKLSPFFSPKEPHFVCCDRIGTLLHEQSQRFGVFSFLWGIYGHSWLTTLLKYNFFPHKHFCNDPAMCLWSTHIRI